MVSINQLCDQINLVLCFSVLILWIFYGSSIVDIDEHAMDTLLTGKKKTVVEIPVFLCARSSMLAMQH